MEKVEWELKSQLKNSGDVKSTSLQSSSRQRLFRLGFEFEFLALLL